MQSFIISSKNLDKGRQEAIKLTKEQKVNGFDLTVLDEFEKDLGIEDVRNIQKNIYLSPGYGDKKALILILQKGATIEAQNSMLKLLEEPPPSALIYIVVGDYRIFLPTIISRVKLIELEKNETIQSELTHAEFFENLQINGDDDALLLAQDLGKDKNMTIEWLEHAILAARGRMIENLSNKNEALKLRKTIHSLEIAHYDLKNTNTNPRLALENLFLSI